jgi:hypothetical protein
MDVDCVRPLACSRWHYGILKTFPTNSANWIWFIFASYLARLGKKLSSPIIKKIRGRRGRLRAFTWDNQVAIDRLQRSLSQIAAKDMIKQTTTSRYAVASWPSCTAS